MKDIKCVDDAEFIILQQDGVKAIDIRTETEWKTVGVIKNSVLLTFFNEDGTYNIDTWIKKFQKIVKSQSEKFILICAHANRTKVVGNFLRDKMGYENVLELCGGIEYGWLAKGKKIIVLNKD